MNKKLSIIMIVLLGLTVCLTGHCEEMENGAEDIIQQTFSISLADSGSEYTANYAAGVAFKEFVESNSDGRITVALFPNGQLGNDRELIEAVQMGQVTMHGTSTGQHVNFHPELGVFDAPFAFRNKDDVYALFEQEDFSDAFSDMFESRGFKFAGMYVAGFRTLTSNREVRNPDDLMRLDIRTMENPNQMAVWRAFEANPTPISFTELYTALQQGVVAAQENPIELIYSQKFYEQQKYVVFTNHQAQIIIFTMNIDFYNSLPEDLKEVVDEGFKVLTMTGQNFVDENEEKYIQEMKEYGVTFIDLDPDTLALFKDKTASVWDMVGEKHPEFYKIYREGLDKVIK